MLKAGRGGLGVLKQLTLCTSVGTWFIPCNHKRLLQPALAASHHHQLAILPVASISSPPTWNGRHGYMPSLPSYTTASSAVRDYVRVGPPRSVCSAMALRAKFDARPSTQEKQPLRTQGRVKYTLGAITRPGLTAQRNILKSQLTLVLVQQSADHLPLFLRTGCRLS